MNLQNNGFCANLLSDLQNSDNNVFRLLCYPIICPYLGWKLPVSLMFFSLIFHYIVTKDLRTFWRTFSFTISCNVIGPSVYLVSHVIWTFRRIATTRHVLKENYLDFQAIHERIQLECHSMFYWVNSKMANNIMYGYGLEWGKMEFFVSDKCYFSGVCTTKINFASFVTRNSI